MMTTHKGLRLDVYRAADRTDCTAGGITSTHTRLTLIGTIDRSGTFSLSPEGSEVFESTTDAPAVALRHRLDTAHLVPVDAQGAPVAGRWYMSGGNFASTTDSRLADYYKQLGLGSFYGAISVHDRFEG